MCDSVRAVLMGVESVQSLKTYENIARRTNVDRKTCELLKKSLLFMGW